MSRVRSLLLCFGIVSMVGLLMADVASAKPRTCGAPPKAKPQRRKGGESVPPLPLPATPLRRTEKKRPPSPPALVGKVQYGKIIEWIVLLGILEHMGAKEAMPVEEAQRVAKRHIAARVAELPYLH